MMEQDFLGYINDNHLFVPTERVLLAVSGGLDSATMAELFHRVGQPFAIAHVNFGLRDVESDADAAFVENKANQYGVPFHLTHFDTATVAAERGISIQMAARELRYGWFSELCTQYGYACVATAHHQNDVLETMLLNLTRGTGLAGLHGIAPRNDRVVRPVLFATRQELAKYAQDHNVTFREDRSNAEDKYARNRIRHHVVPVLADLNPGFWQTLPRTVERLRAAETLLQAELNRSWQATAELNGQTVLLPAHKVLALAEPVFQLAEWLKPFGFSADQARQMIDSLHREIGQQFQSASHRVTHGRINQNRSTPDGLATKDKPASLSGLRLEPLPVLTEFTYTLTDWPEMPIDVASRFTLKIDILDKPVDFPFPTDPLTACFDADRLTFPLTIRSWQLGDRFRPLGLNGHKLVSDLLNDLKLTRSEREQTTVLLSNNQIAWVIGRRIDHRFRVTAQTKRVVCVRVTSL